MERERGDVVRGAIVTGLIWAAIVAGIHYWSYSDSIFDPWEWDAIKGTLRFGLWVGVFLLFLYGVWVFNPNRKPEDTADPRNAREALYEDLRDADYLSKDGIRIGLAFNPKTKFFEPIRYNGESHLGLIAPARTGKARDILIPALLEYGHSCVVIDPKGQLCAVTGAQREKFGRVIVLSPFRDDVDNILPVELKRWPQAHYNPMAKLNPKSIRFGPDCDSLASALVMEEPEGKNHWVMGARRLVSGLIMFVAQTYPEEKRHLRTVNEILSMSDSDLAGLAKIAAKQCGGMVAERLRAFGGEGQKNEGELQSIMSNARTEMGFIANDAIGGSVGGSSFRFDELKETPCTVFLILPANYLGECGRWFRLVLSSALEEFMARPGGRVPVLAIIDEFAQLGKLDTVQTAISQVAGFGLQLWPILQDMGQLNRLYGKDGAQTFMSGFAVKQFFAPRDPDTAEFVSRECGDRNFSRTTISTGTNPGGSTSGTSTGEVRERLFWPQQIRQLEPECSWLFMEKVNGVTRAGRMAYWRSPEFKGLWKADPYHKAKRQNL